MTMQDFEIRKLDRLFQEKVKEKFFGRCAVCGLAGDVAHHFIGRWNFATRWYLPNGIWLCNYHHTESEVSAHLNKAWFNDFIEQRLGSVWFIDLQFQARGIFKGTFAVVEKHMHGITARY